MKNHKRKTKVRFIEFTQTRLYCKSVYSLLFYEVLTSFPGCRITIFFFYLNPSVSKLNVVTAKRPRALAGLARIRTSNRITTNS